MEEKLYPIPKNINECFEVLDDIFSGSIKEQEEFKNLPEEKAVSSFHNGLGRWIRNSWGLWTKDTDLYILLSNMGLWHADDMSSVILASYHKKIHGKDLLLKEQIQYYTDYWNEYEKINGPVEKNN